MKLTKVTIYKYKSFLTEQSVDIELDITRIVGKNESGKSAPDIGAQHVGNAI